MTASEMMNKIDLSRAFSSFMMVAFTSVCLWLGSTVSTMSQEIAKLGAVIESQVKITDSYAAALEALATRLRAVELDIARGK